MLKGTSIVFNFVTIMTPTVVKIASVNKETTNAISLNMLRRILSSLLSTKTQDF